MDIELLRTFLEVSQTRHFGRAAEKLFITPAAVSARIRQLEQSLGVSLFYRTRGNNQMTPEGERLLPHAHQMLKAWQEARQDLARESEPTRSLHLGAPSGLWQSVLCDVPGHLRERHPQLTLRVEAGPVEVLVERVRAEQMDLALMAERPDDAALQARKLRELSLVLLSRDPRLSFAEALAGPYIAMDWGAAFALFQAKRLGEVSAGLYTDQVSVAREALSQPGASVYLPAELAGEAEFPVGGAPVFHRTLYGVCRAEGEFTPGVQAVMSLLAEPHTPPASGRDR